MFGVGEVVHLNRKAERFIDCDVLCFREKVAVSFVPHLV